jgi:hypothetical protein
MSEENDKKGQRRPGPRPIGEILLEGLPSVPKRDRKPLQQRLLEFVDAPSGDPSEILYQHSVLCQTCLPYRPAVKLGSSAPEW